MAEKDVVKKLTVVAFSAKKLVVVASVMEALSAKKFVAVALPKIAYWP